MAASAVPDSAFAWMLDVAAEDVTYEKLATSEMVNLPGFHLDFGTLDAKLGSALTKVASASFVNTMQAKKHAAMKEKKRLLGRQIMFLIDAHFKMTEADGAVYDIEHLLSVVMTNDNLQAFLNTWDTFLSGLQAAPESSMLEALLLRQI